MSSIAPKKRPVGVRFLHKIACYFLDLCVVLLGVSYGNNSPFRRLMCVRLKLIFTILCNQVERYFPCTIVMLKRKKVFISWHCPHCIILLLNIIYSIAHCCAPCNISSGHQKDVFGNIKKKHSKRNCLLCIIADCRERPNKRNCLLCIIADCQERSNKYAEIYSLIDSFTGS